MGSCTSKRVHPISTMSDPGFTMTSSVSTHFYADVMDHLHCRDRVVKSVHQLFDQYAHNVQALGRVANDTKRYKLTVVFYELQRSLRASFLENLKRLSVYDHTILLTIMRQRLVEIDELYEMYLKHLYARGCLVVDAALLQQKEIRAMFGIKKQLTFSNVNTVYIVPAIYN